MDTIGSVINIESLDTQSHTRPTEKHFVKNPRTFHVRKFIYFRTTGKLFFHFIHIKSRQ